jgi:hypothetical protein
MHQRENASMYDLSKKSDRRRFDDDFAVYAAMLKAGFKPKAKLTPAQHARRRAFEKLLQRQRYCDAFALWRDCERRACRRAQRCSGDATRCLKRALALPPQLQLRTRDALFAGTPPNIGAPEREARQCMPYDL